jgi:hypothetical protein
MCALCVGECLQVGMNAVCKSSIARVTRGLLMLRGSRGCVPHLVLVMR